MLVARVAPLALAGVGDRHQRVRAKLAARSSSEARIESRRERSTSVELGPQS